MATLYIDNVAAGTVYRGTTITITSTGVSSSTGWTWTYSGTGVWQGLSSTEGATTPDYGIGDSFTTLNISVYYYSVAVGEIAEETTEQMVPILLDSDFSPVALLESYISFIWTDRYYKCGDFELVLPMAMRETVEQGAFISRSDDANIGIIETLTFRRDEDLRDTIIVSGRFLPGLLARRIDSLTDIPSTWAVDFIIQYLVNNNAASPSVAARQIPNMSVSIDTGTLDTAVMAFQGKDLLTIVESLCNTYGVGFKMPLESGVMVFHLYNGEDRSASQSTNPPVVFSDDLDNLEASEYVQDITGRCTASYVVGEPYNGTDGNMTDKFRTWAADTPTGLERFEKTVNAENVSSASMTLNQFNAALVTAGKLAWTKYAQAFSGQVVVVNYKYREDFNVGDLVTIRNSAWGIEADARIVEVIESTSEAGEYTITLTFGA